MVIFGMKKPPAPRVVRASLSLLLMAAPLVSARAESGEPMPPQLKEQVDVTTIEKNITRATEILAAAVNEKNTTGKTISNQDLDQLLRIWNTLNPLQKQMTGDQTKIFKYIFIDKIDLDKVTSEEQKRKVATMVTNPLTDFNAIPKKVPFTAAAEVSRTVPRYSHIFPADISVPQKRGELGIPDITLAASIEAKLNDSKDPVGSAARIGAFKSVSNTAIREEVVWGPGSEEAKEAGRKIADTLRNIPGNPQHLLGRNYQQILADLDNGNIKKALSQVNVILNISEVYDKIVLVAQTAAFSVGFSTPNIFVPQASVYLSGQMLLDSIISEQYKIVPNEEGRIFGLEPKKTNFDLLARAGPKAAFQLFTGKTKGIELVFSPALLALMRADNSHVPTFGAGIDIRFNDVSGKHRWFGDVPVFSMAQVRYQNVGGKNKVQLDAGLTHSWLNLGNWTLMSAINVSGIIGEGPLPQSPLVVSIGPRARYGEDTTFSVQAIIGKDVVGTGVGVAWRSLVLDLKATRSEIATLGRLDPFGGWTVHGALSINLDESR